MFGNTKIFIYLDENDIKFYCNLKQTYTIECLYFPNSDAPSLKLCILVQKVENHYLK